MDRSDLTRPLLDFLLAKTDEKAGLVLAGAPELLADETDQMLEEWIELNDYDEGIQKRIRKRRRMLAQQRKIEATSEERRVGEGSAEEWAQTQNQLGDDYLGRSEGSPAENLGGAIGAYRRALTVWTRASAPQRWATAQNNLGVAFLQWLEGDRVENQERAIESFLAALEVRRKDVLPVEWARTLTNLGNAYAQRLRCPRWENLQRASKCHRQALTVLTEQEHPTAWAQTTLNLGNVYGDLHEEGMPGANERAIECYRNALRVFTREEFSFQWAMAQSNLANALADRMEGDRAQNLAEAVTAARLALRVQTRDEFPWEWARTQANLGAILWEQTQDGEEGKANEAVRAIERALEVYSAEVDPKQHRRTQTNLAEIFFARRRWREAYEGYAAALGAHERLYEATSTPEARWAELTSGVGLLARAAYCLARLGRPGEALEVLEAGRTRTWVELLARREAVLETLRDEDREAFDRTRQQIRRLEAKVRSGSDDFLEISSALQAARKELTTVVRRIRAYEPEFLPRGLDSEQLHSLANRVGRWVVYLLTTSHGSLALIVPSREDRLQSESMLFLDDFREEHLWRILEKGGGYLDALRAEDASHLMRSLERSLPELRERLMQSLAKHLKQQGVRQVTLVPCDRLGLLPLAAAMGDDLLLTLAPSGRLLESAERHHQTGGWEPSLLAVAQPVATGQPLLGFLLEEVEAIWQRFAAYPQEILREEGVTLPAVTASVPGKSVLHFACHGVFDADEPLDSALYLARGSRLTLRDLLNGELDLSSARLVVLAACQSGAQEYARLPDEALGFPAGFMAAGVPAVVGTLWRVSDLSTALFMERFYRHLIGDHISVAEALGRARQWLRDATAQELGLVERYERLRHSRHTAQRTVAFQKLRYWKDRPSERPFEHPYFWAGFVLVGVS